MVSAIALFSGGLDSILACRVVMSQSIRVQAIKFVTPFFEYDLLAHEQGYVRRIKEKYGIDVVVRDISEQYMDMLRNPPHGYGKNFNPCVDCKIMMMQEAKRLLPEYDASFLISGEVVGQRPMSQRKDTLRIIERDSGCDDILLRPLCAKLLPPTKPELDGLVDREKLLALSGRSRQGQMDLAKEFGISDYPSPAGGCVLTDLTLGKRFERFYAEHQEVSVADMLLLQVGRQFELPHGAWLTMGRRQEENAQVAEHCPDDAFLVKIIERPGPTAVLRYVTNEEDFIIAAGLMARYGKKVAGSPEVEVRFQQGDEQRVVKAEPLQDKVIQPMAR